MNQESGPRQGRLYVLIVHYNTPELTGALVKTLPTKTPSGRRLFVRVLDNSSEPENLATLSSGLTNLPHVEIRRSNRNVGFGCGMNILAAEVVSGGEDILWLLNPDTRLDTDCIALLEQELDRGTFDIVSPLILCGENTRPIIWYCGGTLDLRAVRVTHDLYGLSPAEAPKHTFETEFITGAAPMMRAATFAAIGGFKEGYFLYWEDIHLSWRARQLGLRLGVVPTSVLWHAVGASSGSGQSATFYYWACRNRFVFARDIGANRRRLFTPRAVTEPLRMIARAGLEGTDRLSKISAALRGTAAGISSLLNISK